MPCSSPPPSRPPRRRCTQPAGEPHLRCDTGRRSLSCYRAVLLADGLAPAKFPAIEILIYGGVFTAVSALIFVPSYLAWQDAVGYVRDQLFPVPANGIPSHDWSQGRGDFDTMLSARSSAGSVFTAAFGILAPLAGSLLTALIPTS